MCVCGAYLIVDTCIFRHRFIAHMLHSQSEPSVDAMDEVLPTVAIVQTGVGGIALAAGITFLKLRSWSRVILEVVTGLSLLFGAAVAVWVITIYRTVITLRGP